MPTICVHKLASCFCSKNLVSLFLAWVVPSVNVRQATAQVGLSPVKFAVENNFCTAGRTSHECPTFNAASGVDSTRCANTRRVPRGAGVGRRYREARRSVALNRCCRDLSNPRRGQKNAVPLLPLLITTATDLYYTQGLPLHTPPFTTSDHFQYHYHFQTAPLPLPTTMTTKNQEHHGKSIGAPPKNWTALWKRNDALQKRKTLFERPILFLKKLANSIEKMPRAPFYKMVEAKRQTLSLKNTFNYQKSMVFSEKRSILDDKKKLEHRGKNSSVCFWLQAFCKTVLWAFFQWNLLDFFWNRIGFSKRVWRFWSTSLCFHRTVQFLGGALIDFPRCSIFFSHPR